MSAVATKGGAAISEHRLANGLHVLVAERRGDPAVAVMTWYRVGSIDEREHEAGVSHFLEHMMFKGSQNFAKGAIDRITTELGGANNAFTSFDHTGYWFEFASDRWERALEIEADRMRSLLLDEKEFEAERAVVLEELSMGQDDPWRVLSERVQSVAFERHPYRRPIIGFPDALSKLSAADMRDYWRRFYHPANATLVIAGDVDARAAIARVEAHFGGLEPGLERASATAFRGACDEPRGQRRLETRWDDQGKRLCLAFPSARFATPDDHALDVIAGLLSGGRMARLYRHLVMDTGLATSISAQNDSRVEGGLFWIFAECAQNVAPEKLERAVWRELDRLGRVLVPRTELARTIATLRSTEAYDEETVSDLAEKLGEFAVDAQWRLALSAMDELAKVDARRVREVAGRLLRPERAIVGWCLPQAGTRSAKSKPRR